MIYAGDVDTSLYQAKVPGDYDTAFQAFLRVYPAYAKTAVPWFICTLPRIWQAAAGCWPSPGSAAWLRLDWG
jgi:hypothetical protein